MVKLAALRAEMAAPGEAAGVAGQQRVDDQRLVDLAAHQLRRRYGVGSAQHLHRLLEVAVEHLRGRIIAPGFIDMHIHFPQTDVIGSPAAGLLPWLEDYTFPHESRFSDEAHAQELATFFLDELLRHGVTTPLAFATSHPSSVNALMEEAQRRGLRALFRTIRGAAMLKHRSLVMIFSDLLVDTGPVIAQACVPVLDGDGSLLMNLGSLVTIAKDVKLQVEFNPRHVAEYRLEALEGEGGGLRARGGQRRGLGGRFGGQAQRLLDAGEGRGARLVLRDGADDLLHGLAHTLLAWAVGRMAAMANAPRLLQASA